MSGRLPCAPCRSLRRLAALCLVLVAVVALSWSGTGPAAAQDGYEPDPQVVADVWGYAQETGNGFDHVLRWVRVLQTFGAVEGMTAAEAQGLADRYWASRWEPVAAELARLERAGGGYEPDPQVVAAVWGYAQETGSGFDHVLRWVRVLKTFGAVEDVTAAEARGYAGQHLASRWDPVVAELAAMEEPASGPNRAPVVHTQAWRYDGFVGEGNAPRGVLVSKIFTGIFSDPDGDELTYTVSVPEDRRGLVGSVGTRLGLTDRNLDFLFIRVGAEDDWKTDTPADNWGAVTPALPDPLVTTVTLTATDPEGLSASVTGDFVTDWASHPALEAATAEAAAVELTFDQAVLADPAPAPGQFTVNTIDNDGSAGTVAVERVVVEGAVVTLELASALQEGHTVTLDYVHDDDAPLTRAAGGGDAAPGFAGQAVEVSVPDRPCAGSDPPYVTSIRVENTFNVAWVTPTAPESCELTGFIVELQGEDGSVVRSRTSDPTLTTMTVQVPGPAVYLVRVYATYTAAASNTPRTLWATTLWADPGTPNTARSAFGGGFLGGIDIGDFYGLYEDDEPRMAFFQDLSSCTISLTLTPNVDYGITGTWTGSSLDCRARVRVQHKLKARTMWDSSPWISRDARARAFLYYDLDPVDYDFRLEFTDIQDTTRTGATGTVMVRDNAAVAPQVGRAENVRLEMRNDNDADVYWDAPASTPTGYAVDGFYVEWWEHGKKGTTLERAQCTWDQDGSTMMIDEFYPAGARASGPGLCDHDRNEDTTNQGQSGMIGLTEGAAYRAQVVTQLVDDITTASAALTAAATSLAVADASGITPPAIIKIDDELMLVTAKNSNTLTLTRGHMTTTAADHSNGATVYLVTHATSAATRLPQTAMYEPLKVWFIADTPNYNSVTGRIFMHVDANKINVSATCWINGGNINCPPRTLVSLSVWPGGAYSIRASGSYGDESFSNSQVMRVENLHEQAHTLPQVPEKVRLSADTNRMLVSWDAAPFHRMADTQAKRDRIVGYVIETRHSNDGGTNWSAWATAATVDKSVCVAAHGDRIHCERLLTGLNHQMYQVRISLRTLHAELRAGRTELNVFDAGGIAVNDVIQIGNERMLVTAKSGNTLTVTRGHDGTTAASHNSPAVVSLYDSQTSTLTSATTLAKSYFLGISSFNHTVTMPTTQTGPAGPVANPVIQYPGDGKLRVKWDKPADDGGAEVYGYILHYREQREWGSDHPYTEIKIYPRDLLRDCGGAYCTNPRSVLLTGLTSNTPYMILMASLNVNGRSPFYVVGVAAPDGPIKLVGNSGQAASSFNTDLSNRDVAQAFTTGTHGAGYVLTSVKLDLVVGTGNKPTYTVRICTDLNCGTVLGTLTNPNSLSSGLNTFKASGNGIDLTASTEYWVVIDTTAVGDTRSLQIQSTQLSDEDAGGATGWSIADGSRGRPWNTTGWSTVIAQQIEIHGNEK